MRGKFVLIAIGLLTVFRASAEQPFHDKYDFTHYIAAGMVATQCRKAGMTSINVDVTHIIEIGMKKTGLSQARVVEIMQQPETAIKAGDEASRMARKISQGRLTCDDAALYIIGGLMQ